MADQDPTTRRFTTQTQPGRQRGNGRIFSREGSANLWCAYYLRGKEYRESTGTTDRKKAECFLKRRLKEVGADQIGAKPFGGPQQDRLAINQLLDALKADYELRGKLTPQFGSHLARIRDTSARCGQLPSAPRTLTSTSESNSRRDSSPRP